jgi:hypothetical protein
MPMESRCTRCGICELWCASDGPEMMPSPQRVPSSGSVVAAGAPLLLWTDAVAQSRLRKRVALADVHTRAAVRDDLATDRPLATD